MGFNLKEKWQEANKKNIAIIALSLIAILACLIGGVKAYQYHTMKTEITKQSEGYANLPMDLSEGPKKPSEYNIGIEYNQALKGDKPIVALFYADWCHFCIKFMPVYQEISEKYKDILNFAKVNVEDKKYEKVVNEIGITGYPTVFIIDPKYDNQVLISNALLGNSKDISKELDRYVRIRKILDSKK